MDEIIIRRMDEVVALRRRIKFLGMTIKEVCWECGVAPKTFSSWAAGKGRNLEKWEAVCDVVSHNEELEKLAQAGKVKRK